MTSNRGSTWPWTHDNMKPKTGAPIRKGTVFTRDGMSSVCGRFTSILLLNTTYVNESLYVYSCTLLTWEIYFFGAHGDSHLTHTPCGMTQQRFDSLSTHNNPIKALKANRNETYLRVITIADRFQISKRGIFVDISTQWKRIYLFTML